MTALPQPTAPRRAAHDATHRSDKVIGNEFDSRLLDRRRRLPAEATTQRARLASALCFAGVCVAMVIVGAALVRLDDPARGAGGLLVSLGAGGIPAALLLGWKFGPRAGWADFDELLGLACGVGVLAVLIGDATVVAFEIISTSLAGVPLIPEDVAGALLIYSLGLLFFGIPALLATIPASLIWIAVYRTVVARRVRPSGSPER